MTVSKKKAALLLVLVLLIGISVGTLLFGNTVSTATAQGDGENVLWKQECPFHGLLQISQLGRGNLVMCIERR